MKKRISTTGDKGMTAVDEAGGIDLGDRMSEFCRIDKHGQAAERVRLRTTLEGLRKAFACRPPMRIAIEVGTHSPWVSRALAELGHEVIVANARRVHLISRSSKKNDPKDAELLARLARLDPELLHPIQHRGEQAQADLAKLRARKALVVTRQRLISHVRGAVKSYGTRIRRCSTAAFHNKAPQDIPSELWPAMSPLIDTIADLTRRIAHIERALEVIAHKRYPETEQLRQVKGVGLLLSLHFVLVLDDPSRFRKSRDVGPFVGLRPRMSASGERDPELSITKEGDRELRTLLVQGAHYVLGPFGPDTDLRRWGLKLAARGGKNAKKRAAVAVARKLAVLLHRLWVTDRRYTELVQEPAA